MKIEVAPAKTKHGNLKIIKVRNRTEKITARGMDVKFRNLANR